MGSNSLYILVQMKVYLSNKNFENIKIQNTSSVGANFFRSNLSGSEFNNVFISGMNLNGALLFNCKWKNLKIHELYELGGHSCKVNSVCLSPDGNTLASGNDDKSIRLWDVKSGQQKAKLDSQYSDVYSVCFSPDGNLLAAGNRDNFICLWDVQTVKQKALLSGHTNNVNSVCFSPDGNRLASCSCDNNIRLWDIKTKQQKAKLDGHTNGIILS
ncbi:unnamed protein product [Paramecium pentaurelia]|uniref:Uncharacterized protein n=1 Tax=Paramecium pentaurelia TaxID=43138 RepID=A0A8S1U1P2_9CILI|nr:unnamed protein product [Paramecium pentaurelia]